jgi:hypothetical protein
MRFEWDEHKNEQTFTSTMFDLKRLCWFSMIPTLSHNPTSIVKMRSDG